MTQLRCLRTAITSGGREYPVFIGFLPARKILEIASAPAFAEQTAHSAIARNVLDPPIKDWQRPLKPEHVQSIAKTFDDQGELMPNPVLLAQNLVRDVGRFEIAQERSQGGGLTNVWIVDIPDPVSADADRPLWILDGQHRINGLAQSAQRDNEIPMVLLLNEDIEAYQASTFAKLFAQVTTAATPLHPLHNEWLTFVFRLKQYARSEDDYQAMSAVAALCERQALGVNGPPNPFFNRIRFNPFSTETAVRPQAGGFEYTCAELKDIIKSEYYAQMGASTPLDPYDVAMEIGRSYVALQQAVPGDQRRTAFFGDRTSGGHKPVQDAYLVGVLAHLRTHGRPSDWRAVLDVLNFSGTRWDFSSWSKTTAGTEGLIAREVATKTFRTAFTLGALPEGNRTLDAFLQGNSAAVQLRLSFSTDARRPINNRQQPALDVRIEPGVDSPDSGGRRHLRVMDRTDNIGRLNVIQPDQPFKKTFAAPMLKRGVYIDDDQPNPLNLVFEMVFYGGRSKTAEINLWWKPQS